MSKAVLISIQPKWCELIAFGKKTIEVRKTRPKLDTPFKGYIYETKGPVDTPFVDENGHIDFHGRGKVIGEFMCCKIEEYHADNLKYGTYDIDDDEMIQTCLTSAFLWHYGKGKILYGYHITNVVIYDSPKEIGEFKYTEKTAITVRVKNPHQSWCYVEEIGGD